MWGIPIGNRLWIWLLPADALQPVLFVMSGISLTRVRLLIF